MRAILALFVVLSLIAQPITIGNTHDVAISHETYKEITDINTLAIKAWTEYRNMTPAEKAKNGTAIRTTQLLEKTVYANGDVDSNYAAAEVMLIGSDGDVLTLDDFTESFYGVLQGTAGGMYDVSFVLNCYYHSRMNGTTHQIRVYNTTVTMTDPGTVGIYCTKVVFGPFYRFGILYETQYEWRQINNPVSGTTYTKATNQSGYSDSAVVGNMYGSKISYVELSNGNQYYSKVVLYADELES